MQKITSRQRRFIDEYLIDLNGTQAAIRAGYSPKTANEKAAQLLAKVSIKAEIDQAMKEREKRTEITQDYVLKTIHGTIERCKQAEPLFDKQGKPLGLCKFDAGSVLKGCELLGKHLGMLVDRKELSGPNGGPIAVQRKLDSMTDEELLAIIKGDSPYQKDKS